MLDAIATTGPLSSNLLRSGRTGVKSRTGPRVFDPSIKPDAQLLFLQQVTACAKRNIRVSPGCQLAPEEARNTITPSDFVTCGTVLLFGNTLRRIELSNGNLLSDSGARYVCEPTFPS